MRLVMDHILCDVMQAYEEARLSHCGFNMYLGEQPTVFMGKIQLTDAFQRVTPPIK